MPGSVSNAQPHAQATTSSAPKRKRRWVRYLLLGFLLFFIAGEIGLRVFVDRHSRFNIFIGAFRERDPHRQSRLRRNYQSGPINLNSKGILGPEFDARKTPGSYRIVTLGDSTSFVPTPRNYPRILEERLNETLPQRRIDIINASCPGYSSIQAQIWYEEEINSYEHDMLIIFLGWNDMGRYNPDGLVYKLEEIGYLKEPTLLQRALLNCYLLRSVYVVQGYWQRGRPVSLAPLSEEDDLQHLLSYTLRRAPHSNHRDGPREKPYRVPRQLGLPGQRITDRRRAAPHALPPRHG